MEVKSGRTGLHRRDLRVGRYGWQEPASLTETRVMTFYADPDKRIVDLDITLTALAEGHLRRRQGWRARDPHAPGSAGGQGHRPHHQRRRDGGRKVALGQALQLVRLFRRHQGEKVGIAILDNPANPRHPVRWHARAYGLFAANPFGSAVFTGDKSQDGSITIEPGQSSASGTGLSSMAAMSGLPKLPTNGTVQRRK